MGYHRAGFDKIVGVDIAPQPRYPFDEAKIRALGETEDVSNYWL